MRDIIHWQEQAERLRQNITRPPLKIRDVMKLLGYRSTAAAEYALQRMLEAELVEYVVRDGNQKGEWFLT